MNVVRVAYGSGLWQELTNFCENCSWIAGKHLAMMLRENRFHDWESVFAAMEDSRIIGFCTLLQEDYYPDNRYWPWISSLFVDESARGRRVSHRLIEAAEQHAKQAGFSRVYIPSDMTGFYEKCGYLPIDTLVNYGGDTDTIFAKDL